MQTVKKSTKRRITPVAVDTAQAAPPHRKAPPGAVLELIRLANAGDRTSCAKLIPTLNVAEINCEIGYGSTLLMCACEQNDPEMARLLLSHGARVDAESDRDFRIIANACNRGSTDVVRALRAYIPDDLCVRLLRQVVSSSQPEQVVMDVVSVLLGDEMEKKVSAEPTDMSPLPDATTVLHAAASAGLPRVLEKLVMHGFKAFLNSYDEKGSSPLQVAEAMLRKHSTRMLRNSDLRKYVSRNGRLVLRGRFADNASHSSDDSGDNKLRTNDNVRINEETLSWEAFEQKAGSVVESAHNDGMYCQPGDNSDEETSAPREVTAPVRRRRRHQGPKTVRATLTLDADKAARYRDCVLVLVKAMGIHDALCSDYALNTKIGYKLVVSECGIPAILNHLSREFKMTPWGKVSVGTVSDGTRATIPLAATGCPLCPSGGHEMVLSKRLPNRYTTVSWQCNACSIRGKKTSERWFCEECQDDYCLTCAPLVSVIPAHTIEHSASCSFIEAISAQVQEKTIDDSNHRLKNKESRPNLRGPKSEAVTSSIERDRKTCNSRISNSQGVGDLPEEEKFLSNPDIGFEEDTATDLFIEALTIIAEMHLAASTKNQGSNAREEALAHWTAATNPDHSLHYLHERTVRAVMWCIFDHSSDIMEAVVLVEWATILQEFTNDTVEEHVLPLHCYSNLNMDGSIATSVPPEPLEHDPLSCKLILDIDKDPFYTLCHPSVMSELLMRLTEMGFTIAYGLTGQDWDEEDMNYTSEDLMKRDLDLFLGYLEILLKVMIPRVFPIFEAVKTLENGRDKKNRKGRGKSTGPISLLHEISESLYGDLTLLFGAVETILSLITGELIEDQAERVSTLLSSVYLWELLCEVTTFDPHAVGKYLNEAVHGPLLNYMSNATPLISVNGQTNRRGRSNKLKNSNKERGQSQNVRDNNRSARSFDGLWLGEKWRFFMDAMSYHTKSNRKIDMTVDDLYRPIARSPIVSLTGPVICLRPTAEEVTDLLLQATAGDATSIPKRKKTGANDGARRKRRSGGRGDNHDNELRCLTNMTKYLFTLNDATHPIKLPIPRKFQELLRFKGEGVRWLVGGYTQALGSSLKFLMRFPWVLQDDQVLAFVNDSLYALAQNSGDQVNTIMLNRFTDPTVWVESIVQQLSVYDRSLHKKELGIEYDDEPGTGPGPMKEFFELSRILFELKPLNKKSLSDMVTGKNKTKDTPVRKRNNAPAPEDTPIKPGGSVSRVPYEATSATTVAMSDLLPIFQPAGQQKSYYTSGDCSPTSILPVSIDAICERFPMLLKCNAAHSGVDSVHGDGDAAVSEPLVHDSIEQTNKNGARNNTRRDNQKTDTSTARDLRKKVTSLFEGIGILLGHSIRNECPMGVSLPVIVWAMLLGDSVSSFNWIDFCGDDKQLLNSCASILDEPNVEDLHLFFESTICSYQISKVVDTAEDNEAGAASLDINEPAAAIPLQRAASSVSGGLAINMIKREIELVPNGSSKAVTNENKKQFVQLYAKVEYLNKCEDSIAAMRKGLLKVIPDEYLRVLSPVYIMRQVRGEDSISVPSLRAAVSYEGGFSATHRVIRMFWNMVETEFSTDDIRRLLLFWTGNSVAPSDGFRDDQVEDERLVIVKMSQWEKRGANMKAKLPEASTCDKHMYLPNYKTIEEMRTAVRAAIVYSCLGYDRL